MWRKFILVLGCTLVVATLFARVVWADDVIYVVQPGDTLYRIGVNHGVPWPDIMRANGLTSSIIYVGQRLVIPNSGVVVSATPAPVVTPVTSSSPGGSYTVALGDTLWAIARRFGLTLNQVLAANPNLRPNLIYPGQVILLPGGSGASPVATPIPVAAPPAANSTPSDATGLPVVSQRARDIYQQGLALGNNPRAFAKVGDCNATLPNFFAPFDAGAYQLGGPYAYLQETITQFSGSFARDSVAVHIGFTAYDILHPEFANPNFCNAGETPLQCEYRLQRPSIAFISLGTNDWSHGVALYEQNMRAILEQSIAAGVLPILSTKADNMEGYHRYNDILRRLAGEYNVPLWDFWLIAQRLPGGGVLADGYHLTGGWNNFTQPETIAGAWPWRNLTGLEALDMVWRGMR